MDNFNPTFPVLDNLNMIEGNNVDDMEHNPLKHLIYIDD